MQDLNEARVLKIISPFEFLLEDVSEKSLLRLQVQPTQNRHFAHLLPVMFKENINYEVEKKKSHKLR